MSVSETELRYRRELLDCFAYAVTAGHVPAFIEQLGDLDWPDAWHDAFREVVRLGEVHPSIQEAFVDLWCWSLPQLPSGSMLRKLFKDDLGLLVDALHILFAPFRGEAPKVLFRGQSREEFEQGITGFSWSQNPLMAESYARIADFDNPKPRLILATFIPDAAIIAQPSSMEYVLDPRMIEGKVHFIHEPTSMFLKADLKNPNRRFDMDALYALTLAA